MVWFCLAGHHAGFWDLSSPTRDGTWVLDSESTESEPLARQGVVGNSFAEEALCGWDVPGQRWCVGQDQEV